MPTDPRILANIARRRARNRAAGICIQCSTPAIPGKSLCVSCKEKKDLARFKRENTLLAESRCRTCGDSLDTRSVVYCTKHYVVEKTRSKTKNDKIRATVFQHYGNKCACPNCPETDRRFLTIDHINNNGAEFRSKHRLGRMFAGVAFYAWIIKNGFPTDLRLMCYNCNSGRHRNGGICPHMDPPKAEGG